MLRPSIWGAAPNSRYSGSLPASGLSLQHFSAAQQRALRPRLQAIHAARLHRKCLRSRTAAQRIRALTAFPRILHAITAPERDAGEFERPAIGLLRALREYVRQGETGLQPASREERASPALSVRTISTGPFSPCTILLGRSLELPRQPQF